MSEPIIQVRNVSKNFILPHEKTNSLKQRLIHPLTFFKSGATIQHALQNIDLDLYRGEFVGIVGRNGSGKSTLLKILASIYQPTKGDVQVRGSLVPFIELGVGFNPELTGRENVFLSGALLGFSKDEIEDKYDSIVEFAELKKFMDQKLKNYSSGMQVRLAFSIAVQAQADILLLDEVLAVGDAAFQRKCFDYFRQLRKEKKTVILVTHDMDAVRQYCDRAILLDRSKVIVSGSTTEVANKYGELNQRKAGKNTAQQEKRWGSREVYIESVKLTKEKLLASDKTFELIMDIKASQDVEDVIVGMRINRDDGTDLLGTNNLIEDILLSTLKKGEKKRATFRIDNIFNDGIYTVTVSVAHNNGTMTDTWVDAGSFTVSINDPTGFMIRPDIRMTVEDR